MSLPPIDLLRTSWADLFTDLEVWRPLIALIWQRHGLGPIEAIDAGYPGSNVVFRVNRTLWVKIAWPFGREGFMREVECHRLLAAHRPDLPVPRLVVEGCVEPDMIGSEIDWPYMVVTHMPGRRLGDLWADLPSAARCDVARQAGELTRALHDLPLDDVATMPITLWSWQEFIARRSVACIDDFQRNDGLHPQLIAQIPSYLAQGSALYPPDFKPVLLNSDITSDHLLVAPDDGRWRITGLIDFGDATVGHAEYEFTCVHLSAFDGDVLATRCFLAAYGWRPWQPEALAWRLNCYSLLHPYFKFRDLIDGLGGLSEVRTLTDLERGLWGGIPG